MVSSGDADVDGAVERRHRRGRGRAVRDLLPSSSAARANTVPPFEATGRGALPRRFCKSCRKALDVFRDFDGELKTCGYVCACARKTRNANARYGGRTRKGRATVKTRWLSEEAERRERRRVADARDMVFHHSTRNHSSLAEDPQIDAKAIKDFAD